jgi:hypothetical protein
LSFRVTVENDEYAVAFAHRRPTISKVGKTAGVVTLCRIVEVGTNKELAIARAACSAQDNFNRAVGRKIALTRAITTAGLGEHTRRALWNAYWRMCNKATFVKTASRTERRFKRNAARAVAQQGKAL